MMNLVLASGSPRRKQLLEEAGIEFTVDRPDDSAESIGDLTVSPVELVAALAFLKAQNVAGRTEKGLILAADTVAECEGRVLGKPADRQNAFEMLTMMRGKKHFVHTGVCLWKRPNDRKSLQTESTTLQMANLGDTQINDYLDTGLWQGKAGAFGYQDGFDWVHIEKGSVSNVVGLPMDLLKQMMAMKCFK